MIGIGFIIKFLMLIGYFILASILLIILVYVVSRVVQWTARLLGLEVGSFWEWFKNNTYKKLKKD